MKNIHKILPSFHTHCPYLFAILPQQTQAEEYHLGFRITPRISTLGGVLEVAQGVIPWLGLRGGVNYFTYNYKTNESGNDYDIHPF